MSSTVTRHETAAAALAAFAAASARESDRGFALLAAEHVHSVLTDLLEAALVKSSYKKVVLRHDGLLGNFDAKIRIAYLFGLLTKDVRQLIETLQTVRNQAGHSREAFDLGNPSKAVQQALDRLPSLPATYTFPGEGTPVDIKVKASNLQLANRLRIAMTMTVASWHLGGDLETVASTGNLEPGLLPLALARANRDQVRESVDGASSERLASEEASRELARLNALVTRILNKVDPEVANAAADPSDLPIEPEPSAAE